MQAAEETAEGEYSIPADADLDEREPLVTRFGLSRETGSGPAIGHASVPAVASLTLPGAALLTVILTCTLASLPNLVQQADRVIMPIAVIYSIVDELHDWRTWDHKIDKDWAMSASFWGYLLAQPIAGWASTKVTPLLLLWVAVLGWSCVAIFVPLATSISFNMLIISRICMGLTEGVCLPAIFQLCTNYAPAHFRATAFSIVVGCGNAGMYMAFLLCPLIKPWRWMFIGVGIAGLTWCCFVAATFGRMSQRGSKVSVADSEGEDTAAMNSENTTQLQGFALICQVVLNPAVVAVSVAHFAQNWTNYTTSQWWPTLLGERLWFHNEVFNGLWVTAFPYFLMTLANISAGYIADAITSKGLASVRTVRIAATTIGLVGPAMCNLLLELIIKEITARAFVVMKAISYLLGGVASSGYMANHADLSSNYVGLTFSVANTWATVSAMSAGPASLWLLGKSGGLTAMYVVACVINVAAAGVYMLLAKSHRVL